MTTVLIMHFPIFSFTITSSISISFLHNYVWVTQKTQEDHISMCNKNGRNREAGITHVKIPLEDVERGGNPLIPVTHPHVISLKSLQKFKTSPPLMSQPHILYVHHF